MRKNRGARKSLSVSADAFMFPQAMTPEEARATYGPAKSLGGSEDARLAMDSQLQEDGVYSLLAHSFELGQMPGISFMGYGALQNISQNGLIRACVETVTDDMTRAWIRLTGDNADELERVLAGFNLQKIFHDACALVGYEGGAFIFIDTGASGDQLLLPLRANRFNPEIQRGVLRFVVVDPVNVFPGEYNSSNPLREDYFNPASWWVLGQKIHASRLIRLVANEVPVLLKPSYNFLGIAQAQILWDYVLHFQQCREAVARLLTKFSTTVFKTEMEAQITESANWDSFNRRLQAFITYRDNDGILAIDKSEDVIKLETPLAGVTEIVRQALEFLAALNRTPAVKLLGISPSGFNATGESDLRNYYDHISSQQEKVLRAGIAKCLEFVMASRKIEGGADFEFRELGQADETALANVQKTRADIIGSLLDRDVISPEEARKALVAEEDGLFAFIDPEDVPEETNMPTGPDEDVPAQDAIYKQLLEIAHDADEEWITIKGGKHIAIDPEAGEITKGNVGQKSGAAYERAMAIQEKIDSIHIDPDSDNILPNLNSETLEEIGKPDKPVLLKKNILDRNALHHADISLEEAQSLIGEALYKPLKVLKAHSDKDYLNFIGVDKEKHCLVLLDVEDAKDNFEIVHWHRINLYGLQKVEKKDERIKNGTGKEGQA